MTQHWVNIGSGNGLLIDGTNLNQYWLIINGCYGIQMRPIPQEIIMIYIMYKITSEITFRIIATCPSGQWEVPSV